MDERETVLGYFDWEGDPCRVVESKNDCNRESAEIYVPGKGFKPIDISDVYYHGVPISEAEFKSRILRSIARNKQHS